MTTASRAPQDRKPKKNNGRKVGQTFQFTTANGTITMPLLEFIDFGVGRKLRNLDESEAIYTLVESVADEKSLAVIDRMKAAEVGEFIEAYYKASGVDLGESSASAS